MKSFVRVEHAQFTAQVAGTAGGVVHDAQFPVDDYLRARDTVLAFTQVSPWVAPADMPLRTFVERVRGDFLSGWGWVRSGL